MRKRKNGLYAKDVIINGKRKVFYGKTQNGVMNKIAEYNDSISNGRTFEEIADEWEMDHENKVAPSTMACYRPCIRRAKEAFVKENNEAATSLYIKDLTPQNIDLFIKRYCANESPSRKTAAHQLLTVSMICKHAVLQGDLETNPAEYVTLPRGLKKTKRELPTPEELDIIKASVDKPFGLFAYLVLYTGLRRGEALALTYEDIDFENELITVSKSYAFDHDRHILKPQKHLPGFVKSLCKMH